MGITPIANLILLPVSRSAEAEFQVPIAARVENMTRSGDETYSPGGSKGTRGAADDADDAEDEGDSEDATFDETDVADEDEAQVKSVIYGQGSQINYIA
jgi:hypothetical protein